MPLFIGCAGRNVVAGDEKTTSQELAAAVPSWCTETCDFLAVCAMKRGCDCAAGDSCDCSPVPKDCAANCQKELSAYAVGDDVCAQVGQRIMGCVDRLTCDDINQARGSLCEPTSAENTRCSHSSPTDVPPTASGPLAGSAGSPDDTGPSSGGTATAGSSAVAGGSAVAGTAAMGGTSTGGTGPIAGSGAVGGSYPIPGSYVSCAESSGTGGGAFGGAPGALTCEESRDNCSDGHNYSWICAQGSQMQTGCTCFIDGQVTGGFAPGVDDCPNFQLVNAGCGWGLAR